MKQKRQILEYLQAGNSLTQIVALNKFGSFRLSAVVFDLKKETGLNIKNVQAEIEYPEETNFSGMRKDKTKHAEYIIVRNGAEQMSMMI